MENIQKTAIQTLQEHFKYQYRLLVSSKLAPYASQLCDDGTITSISGIPYPFFNTVIGCPEDMSEAFIKEKIHCFEKMKLPFAWFISENEDLDGRQKLVDAGFQKIGTFQGMLGEIPPTPSEVSLSEEYTIECIEDAKKLSAFNTFVCENFEILGLAKDLFGQLLFKESLGANPRMQHWCVSLRGEIVAAVTTLFEDELVSFWNGATAKHLQKQGLGLALRQTILKEVYQKGCRWGATYQMPGSPLVKLWAKVGFKTEWRFDGYLAPITYLG